MGNGSDQSFIVQESHLLALVLDLFDSADDDCGASPEALKELSLFVPFDDFLNEYSSFADLILFFGPQQFLSQGAATTMESLVTPGRMRSSSSGVTTSIYPDLLSLKMKKMLEAPTSTIWFS